MSESINIDSLDKFKETWSQIESAFINMSEEEVELFISYAKEHSTVKNEESLRSLIQTIQQEALNTESEEGM